MMSYWNFIFVCDKSSCGNDLQQTWKIDTLCLALIAKEWDAHANNNFCLAQSMFFNTTPEAFDFAFNFSVLT